MQKCDAALRLLAYTAPANNMDDYVRIEKSTTLEYFESFVTWVYMIFGPQCLRSPNNENTRHLLRIRDARGILDMLGSIYYIHWEWKNCSVTWKGQFCQGNHEKTIYHAWGSCVIWLVDLTCNFFIVRVQTTTSMF